MNNLFLATTLFAAAALAFGLTYFAMKRPGSGRWRESDLLAALVCVGLTALIALTLAAGTAAALDWQDALAELGAAAALGLGLADAGALALAALLIGLTHRQMARGPSAEVIAFAPGAPPPPANRPKARKTRKAA